VKVLVTGADGFVGSHLVRSLGKEHDVIALDYVNPPPRNIPKGSVYFNLDLSATSLESLTGISMPDVIIHAATCSIDAISHNPRLEQVNISAMLNVLEYCKVNDVRLIFTSSCSVYGDGVLHTEMDPLYPLSLYSAGKEACEEYLKFYYRLYGLQQATILRLSNVYGDTTDITNKVYLGKKDVVRVFMEKALKGESLPLVGGTQTRDYTFIDDVVETVRKAMSLRGLDVFNVATGVETSVSALAELIGEVLGLKVKTHSIPDRLIDNVQRRSMDISKMRSLWEPKYSLKEGLKEYAGRMQP